MTIKLWQLLVLAVLTAVFMTTVGMPIFEWFRNAVDLATASSDI
jgi:hypothetical protein